MSYLKRHGTRRVPQWAPMPGQDPNSAGGFAWAVDAWARLRRFLVLGSEGGPTTRPSGSSPARTRRRVERVRRARTARGRWPRSSRYRARVARRRTTRRCSRSRCAAGLGDDETRRAALEALPRVARTGTHLFQFALFVEGFRGWGRSLRRAVGGWYAAQPVDALAYQAVKYRQRDGHDAPRPAPSRPPGAPGRRRQPDARADGRARRLFEWIVRGGETEGLPRIVEGFALAQEAATPARRRRSSASTACRVRRSTRST